MAEGVLSAGLTPSGFPQFLFLWCLRFSAKQSSRLCWWGQSCGVSKDSAKCRFFSFFRHSIPADWFGAGFAHLGVVEISNSPWGQEGGREERAAGVAWALLSVTFGKETNQDWGVCAQELCPHEGQDLTHCLHSLFPVTHLLSPSGCFGFFYFLHLAFWSLDCSDPGLSLNLLRIEMVMDKSFSLSSAINDELHSLHQVISC